MRTDPPAVRQPYCVGRDAELQAIDRHAEKAAGGTPQFVLIEGELGAGKTTVVHEVLERLHWWMHYSVTSLEEDYAHSGLIGKLMRPEIENSVTDYSSNFISTICHETRMSGVPSVAVLEDIQWTDPTSVGDTINGLRSLNSAPLLVILTMRPNTRSDLSRLKRLAESAPIGTHLQLEGFNLGATHQYLEQVAGTPVSQRSAERVQQETGGIPLLMADFVSWIQDNPPHPGRRIASALAAHRSSLRGSANAYRRHMHSLSTSLSLGARRILEALALARSPQPGSSLLEFMEHDGSGLEELISHGFAAYDERSYGYRISSSSLRNVVAVSITPERRARIHLVLSELGDDVTKFEHRLEAVRLDPHSDGITEVLRQGSNLAWGQEKLGHHVQAFEILLSLALLAERKEQIEHLTALAARTGAVHRLADEDLETVLGKLEPSVARSVVSALVALKRGNLESAVAILEDHPEWGADWITELTLYCHAVSECGRLATPSGAKELPGELLSSTLQKIDTFTERLDSATAVPPALLEYKGIIATWCELSHIVLTPGTGMSKSSTSSRSVLDTLESLEESVSESSTLAKTAVQAIRSRFLRHYGDIQGCLSLIENVLPNVDSSCEDYLEIANQQLVISLYYSGRWDEADEIARSMSEKHLDKGETPHSLITYSLAALVPLSRGEERGSLYMTTILQSLEIGSVPAVERYTTYVQALSHAVREDDSSAAELVLKLLETKISWSTIGLMPLTLLARVLHRSGREQDIGQLQEIVDDTSIPAHPALRDYASYYLRGLTDTHPVDKVRYLMESLRCLDRLSPPEASVTGPDRGGFRLQRGLLILDIGDHVATDSDLHAQHRETVAELLWWAHELFRSCQTPALINHAQELTQHLRTHGVPTTGTQEGSPSQQPALDGFHLLTAREREITAMVAHGLKNRHIAESLVISVRTVETHVRNILAKLEIPSRKELYRALHEKTRS